MELEISHDDLHKSLRHILLCRSTIGKKTVYLCRYKSMLTFEAIRIPMITYH